MHKKLIGILIIIAGLAGLVLPIVPGIALIVLGLSLLFGYKFKPDKDKQNSE